MSTPGLPKIPGVPRAEREALKAERAARRACHGSWQSHETAGCRDHRRPAPNPADSDLCMWYALCTNPAEGTVEHPILDPVPTCRRCATRHGLPLEPFPT